MTRLKIYKDFLIKVFEDLHNGNSVKQMMEDIHKFTEINEGTLVGIAGKTLLCRNLIAFGEFKEANEIINSLELTGNDLVDILILETSILYYGGMNDPIIDNNKADEFRRQALELANKKIIFQEKWEEVLIKTTELEIKIKNTEDQKEILNLTNKYVELFQKSGELPYYSDFRLILAGIVYIETGKFRQALSIWEECYETFSKSDISLLPLANIIYTHFILNEIEESKKYLAIALQKVKQTENFWLKGIIPAREAQILEYEQRYDDLELNLINHLELTKNSKNNVRISEREIELLQFYLNRFRNTSNNKFLEKARKLKEEFSTLANNSDDITVKRLNSYANALLLSLGSLKQKNKAVEIYEELIKVYPDISSLKLELIDLYWEDLKFDIDGESKKQVDLLFSQLKNIAYMNQEIIDNSHVSLQILLAKYEFYINKNKDKALDSLYGIQSKAHSYGYNHIEEKITKEVKQLENDLDWNTDDNSIKERLEKVKFKSYIEGAKIFLNEDN